MTSSKKYPVYGLGNAMVDFEFRVTDDMLRSLELEKGLMTLIDPEKEARLFSELSHLPHHKACGGSAANTLIALSQLGAKGFYSCRISDDTFGDFFYQELKQVGIDTNVCAHDRPPGSTGKVIALITPDSERTMPAHLGISYTFCKEDLVPDAIASSEWIYIEGYLSASPTGHEAMLEAKKIAREHNVKVALTLSDASMTRYCKAQLVSVIGEGIDLLFCNEQEALELYDTQDLNEACEKLRKKTKILIVTQGAKGANVFTTEESFFIPAKPAKVIDTMGAGDMFAGAFLWALTQSYPLKKAAEIACLAAADIVSVFGARLNESQAALLREKIAVI